MFNKIPLELIKEHVVTCLTHAEDLCKLKCVNKELSNYIITHPAVLKSCYTCNGNRFNVSSECHLEGCMVKPSFHPLYRFVNGDKYYCSLTCAIH
jgi:hypothetical protein